MAPRILIQYVHVWWTKASRGAPASSSRNAVPREFALPVEFLSESRAATHALEASEASGFAVTRRDDIWTGDGSRSITIGHTKIEHRDVDVAVRFCANSRVHQRTYRSNHDKSGSLDEEVCHLRIGQWAQVVWNERCSDLDEGHWWYTQDTVNVAFIDDIASDYFLATPPVARHSRLIDLF